jgi:hypothetical protein
LTTADRAAGYGHRLTIWQLEVGLTQVFDAPLYGRQFFETVIATTSTWAVPTASICCFARV